MLIDALLITFWLTTRKNMNIKKGWRTFWAVLGVFGLAALLWNLFWLLMIFASA